MKQIKVTAIHAFAKPETEEKNFQQLKPEFSRKSNPEPHGVEAGLLTIMLQAKKLTTKTFKLN